MKRYFLYSMSVALAIASVVMILNPKQFGNLLVVLAIALLLGSAVFRVVWVTRAAKAAKDRETLRKAVEGTYDPQSWQAQVDRAYDQRHDIGTACAITQAMERAGMTPLQQQEAKLAQLAKQAEHQRIMDEIAVARQDALAGVNDAMLGIRDGNPYTPTVQRYKTLNGAIYHSVEELSGALRRAKDAHSEYEERLGKSDHDWQFWYASYLLAEQNPEGMAGWIRSNLSLGEVIEKWGTDFALPPAVTATSNPYDVPVNGSNRELVACSTEKGCSVTAVAQPCWHHPAECATVPQSSDRRWEYDSRPLMD